MMAGSIGDPVTVDGNGPEPLRGAADPDDPLGRDTALLQRPSGRRHHRTPPLLRRLLGAAVLGELDPYRLKGVRGDTPGRRQDAPPWGRPCPGRPPGHTSSRPSPGRSIATRSVATRTWRGSVPSGAPDLPVTEKPWTAGPLRPPTPTSDQQDWSASVSRPVRPRPRARSRPCCPPRRCRRAASG